MIPIQTCNDIYWLRSCLKFLLQDVYFGLDIQCYVSFFCCIALNYCWCSCTWRLPCGNELHQENSLESKLTTHHVLIVCVNFKVMLVCSSSSIVYSPSSRPVKLHQKEGGVGLKWMYSVFKMGKSGQDASLPPLLPGQILEETPGVWRNSWAKKIDHCKSAIMNQLEHSFVFDYSKCYLLGRLYMTNATDSNWGGMPSESHSDNLK